MQYVLIELLIVVKLPLGHEIATVNGCDDGCVVRSEKACWENRNDGPCLGIAELIIAQELADPFIWQFHHRMPKCLFISPASKSDDVPRGFTFRYHLFVFSAEYRFWSEVVNGEHDVAFHAVALYDIICCLFRSVA